MDKNMKICKNCKETISKTDKVCPKCGKDQGKNKAFIVVGVLLAFILCIGILDNSDTNEYQEKNKYTITFMNNGKQIKKVTIDDGELLKKPEDPVKDGYVFSYWSTNGKSVDGSEAFDFTIAPTESITLYAHYTEKEESTNKNTTNNNMTNNSSNSSSSKNNNNNSTKPSSNNSNNTKPNSNSNTNSQSNSNQSAQQQPSNSRPSISVSKQNALKSAKSYLDVTAFSRSGLIEQLEYEKFSNEDAIYAVDNCGANWNEQALKSAKSYLSILAFSQKGLVEQLEYEGFTSSQANYGVSNCGANWNEQAVKSAKSYLDISAFSRDGLIEQLEYEGFTHEQAVYGVSQNGL